MKKNMKGSLTLTDLAPYGGRFRIKSGMTAMTDVLTIKKDTIPASEIPRSTLGMTDVLTVNNKIDVSLVF
jgi:hypothetical protein